MTTVPISVDDTPIEAPWRHGHRRGDSARGGAFEVRRVAGDANTFLIRQSKDLTYEAPFLHLLVGHERALLLDTGDVVDPAICSVRDLVDALLPPGLPLVVAHTHGHGDHVAGDSHFTGRPGTTVVGRDEDAALAGWGFTAWPEEVVAFDLGGRVLEVTGIPGHHPTSVAIHDPLTRTLYTGDSVYPGRLYAEDPALFAASVGRLLAFARTREVERVLGCHIELRARGGDYPIGCRFQPDEAPFPLTLADLVTICEGVAKAGGRRGVHELGPAILWNEPCRKASLQHRVRLWVDRVRGVG